MSPTGARPSERAAKRSMCERFCGDRAGWWAVSLPRSLTKIVSGWSGLSSGWNLRRGVPWANADSTSPATALLPRGSDHLRLEDPDKGQIAIQLPVVQPVAHDEFVWDLKPAILNRQRVHDAPRGFVEQRADVQAGRIACSQRAQQIIGGEAGVDDVLDQEHVPPGDLLVQVFDEADRAGGCRFVTVRRDGHKVAGDRDGDGTGEIGHEGQC